MGEICFEHKFGYIVELSVHIISTNISMKTHSSFLAGLAGVLLLTLATSMFAAEKGKEVTVTGDAKCAKCQLKESSSCKTVIQAEGKDGKTVTYYLADNAMAKGFHENVCEEAKKVTATGTVKAVDGKQELTVTKIDLVK